MALLIDQHLPTRRVMRHKSDKPCVTDYFRQIIRQQHRAFLFANNSLYRSLRNKVIRSSVYPSVFYQKQLCDPRRRWWQHTKALNSLGILPPTCMQWLICCVVGSFPASQTTSLFLFLFC